MERSGGLTGQTFGRWTVLEGWEKTPKGEKKWLCRCQCGTERYVLERALRSGGSLSCGCLRQEAARKAVAHDLTGKTFGQLRVLGPSDRPSQSRGLWWRCQCACGQSCEVLGSLLVTGRKSHCGCQTVKNQPIAQITQQRFGRLTALEATDGRDRKGSVLWRCRCDCGREALFSYNDLMYSNLKSCGCQKKEHDQALSGFLNHIDGTSMEMLASRKVPTNNTTGVRGVYFIKGKYVAKIVFQKKAYYLGTYGKMEDAAAARREAEETVFEAAEAFYARWKACAGADPQWAAKNPATVRVGRDRNDRLCLEFRPNLRQLEMAEAVLSEENKVGAR